MQVNAKINQEGIRKVLIKGGNKDYETHPSPTRSAIFNAGKVSRINVCYFMASLIFDESLWTTLKGQMPVIYSKSSSNKKIETRTQL